MNNKADYYTEGHDQTVKRNVKQNGISSSLSLASNRKYVDEKVGRGRAKFRISFGRGKAQMPSGVPTIREEEEKSTMPQKYENAEEGQSQEVYDATEMISNSAQALRPNGHRVSNPSIPGVESIPPGVGATMSGVKTIITGVGAIIISRGRGRAERKSTDVAENGSAEETSVDSKLLRRPNSLPPAKVKVVPTENKKLLRRPNSLPPSNPSEKQFHCHGCNQNMKHVRPDLSCPFCESAFVEEVDVKPKETVLQGDLKNVQKELEEFRCHNCKEKFKAISCPKMECPFCKSDFLEILSDSSDIFQSDEEQPVTSEDKFQEPLKYFCYQCTLPVSVTNPYVLQCPLCKSGAIEEGWTDAENQHNWSDPVAKGAQEQYSVVEGNEGWTDWKDVQSDPTVSYKTIDKPIENKKVNFIDQQRILMEQCKVKDTTVPISDPSDKMKGFQNQVKKPPIIKREVEVKSKPRQFSKKQVKKVQPLYKDTIAEYKNESSFQNQDNQPTEVKDGKGTSLTKRQMKRAKKAKKEE